MSLFMQFWAHPSLHESLHVLGVCIWLLRCCFTEVISRLQLKPRLFWYRNYQKLHEMVKYRSSRAETWTNRSGISRRVFFNSKKCWKMIIWSKKTQKCCFSWKKSLRSKMPHTKFVKNQKLDIILLNLIKFNYL